MDQYLFFIKDLFSEWYSFTLNNVLYAAALASAVWLLTAILYSIRIALLKRGKAAAEKAALENLHAAQQQLQHTQEELAAATEQMEQAQRVAQDEAQRTLQTEQLVYQRNQHIAGTIQTLAANFDLGERPLLATEDIKADSLWQQHDKVISLLIARLHSEQQAKAELQQACQAETAKLAEKDKQFESLQAALSAQANQLTKLEQAFEEQKSKLKQQDSVQQVLTDTLEKYRIDALRPVAPEPVEVAETQQPIQQEAAAMIETPAIVEDSKPEPIQEEQVMSSPVVETESVVPEIEPVIEIADAVAADISPEPVQEAASETFNDDEQQVNSSKSSLGKIKNLFGKKQQKVKTEPQWAAEKPDEAESTAPRQPDEIEGSPQKPAGKLKGFYSKFKPKSK